MHRALLVIWYGVFVAATGWLLVTGTAYENALSLGAAGRLDAGLVWFYRFRDAGIPGDGSFGYPALPLFFLVVKVTGTRIVWAALLLGHAWWLRGAPLPLQAIALLIAVAGIIWGESALVWLPVLALAWRLFGHRGKTWPRLAGLLAKILLLAVALQLALSLGNPVHRAHRQLVLGGKSFFDALKPAQRGKNIAVGQDCLAVINPDDLRGSNVLETLSLSSLVSFRKIIVLDLKVVEKNYRFLSLVGENGKPLFSDGARKFAEREKAYAASVMPQILTAPDVCLIAAFDSQPALENEPFSRAREILILRDAAARQTKVIQLPVN